MSGEKVVSIDGLTFSYDGLKVLEDVNLQISKNDFVWIVGPNGGGKTTLVKLILGLLQPRRGTVRVFGLEPAEARSRIGYMPQFAHLDPQFPINVLDVVLMGRLGNGNRLGPFRKKDKAVAERVLDEVGLLDMSRRSFSSLSGGQQRRILIARALAGEPDLLILDEPTANLDLLVEKELYDLLRELNSRLTIVMVSHDPAFVSDNVERVVCVKRKVSEHPTCELEGNFIGELFGGEMRLVRHDKHIGKRKNGE
ncbi:MAG TPA: ABC transporter ATP-binding protein [candidate division Zixibacteria bacterium]|nr:ABC transporter ATP-binding protein [candidate division Zixibacteria bacterium]